MRFSLPILLAAAFAGLVSGQSLEIQSSAPTPPTYYFDYHPNTGITGNYIVPDSSKSLCPDLVSVPPQCTVSSLDQAKTICANDGNCLGITCNTGRNDCQLRYSPITSPDPSWSTFNSYTKFSYNIYTDYTLYGTYQVPDASKSTCPDLTSVPPQCTVPNTDKSLLLCANDPACVGLNCNGARGDCQVRYYPVTTHEKRQGFTTKSKIHFFHLNQYQNQTQV